jgi:hypothetical protein
MISRKLVPEALVNKNVAPSIPGRTSRDKPVKYDKCRYRKRNRIEILFERLKDWRHVATRCNRSPKFFLSAIALVATVNFEVLPIPWTGSGVFQALICSC